MRKLKIVKEGRSNISERGDVEKQRGGRFEERGDKSVVEVVTLVVSTVGLLKQRAVRAARRGHDRWERRVVAYLHICHISSYSLSLSSSSSPKAPCLQEDMKIAIF